MSTQSKPLHSGYSDKSVAEKLGFKSQQRFAGIALPADYWPLIQYNPDLLNVITHAHEQVDLLHVFVTEAVQLEQNIRAWGGRIRPSGMLWVSWPKKTSGVISDMSEDRIRQAALSIGLVDIKVCAVSPIWSALKLVWRKQKQ